MDRAEVETNLVDPRQMATFLAAASRHTDTAAIGWQHY